LVYKHLFQVWILVNIKEKGGSFATLAFICIWFCASVVENYKRILLFFVMRKNIFEAEAHKEYFKTSEKEDEIDIKKEMNMWYAFLFSP
jgi:hypothetical protein